MRVRLPFEGKMEKLQRQEKAICQSKGKIQQLCAGFVGNTALWSVPEGKKTAAPDGRLTILCNNDSLYSHLWLRVIHDIEISWYEDQMRCVWHSCLCYLIPHMYCLLSVSVCVGAPWKALKWVALHRFLFVFTAQDQSQVALKLARRGLHCMSPLSNDPEEPASSLMFIQKPDFPLHNTISQVRAVSASMKLIPTVSLCSSMVNTNVMVLASSC